MPTELVQSIVEERMHSVDEDCMKTIRFPPYYPRTVDLDICDDVNLLWDASLNLSDPQAHVFVSEEELLYFGLTL